MIKKKDRKWENGLFFFADVFISIILLFVITIICYYYRKHRLIHKRIGAITI